MEKRLELHEILVDILGSRNVYFQPPETIKMSYPCIIYNRSSIDVKYADNALYKSKTRYKVTIVDKNPDSPIIERMKGLPLCNFDRHYAVDGLNHDVFNLYF